MIKLKKLKVKIFKFLNFYLLKKSINLAFFSSLRANYYYLFLARGEPSPKSTRKRGVYFSVFTHKELGGAKVISRVACFDF